MLGVLRRFFQLYFRIQTFYTARYYSIVVVLSSNVWGISEELATLKRNRVHGRKNLELATLKRDLVLRH